MRCPISSVAAPPCFGKRWRADAPGKSVRTSMTNIRVLIAAAGSGSRAGLPYPKTLHPVRGRPILLRLIDRLRTIDPHPTVVVSPSGHALVADCLARAGVE